MADPSPTETRIKALCKWLLEEGHITPLAQRMIIKTVAEEERKWT